MQDVSALVDVALSVARLGARNALALALLGVLVMLLGQKAFRPVAAAVAAAGAGLAVALALSKWLPEPPVSQGLIVATAAVLVGVLGLLAPTFATIVAAVCFGWLAGDFVGARAPAHAETALLVGVLGSLVAASAIAGFLPRFVTAVVGGLSAAVGAWAWTGASGLSPALFRVPAIWVVLAGVLVVVACAVEQVRYRAAMAAGDRRHAREADRARRLKEQEDRARYDRYMNMK